MKTLKLIKTITEHINNDYKNYAIYALESRGIPNFYDSITNVQRFIIQEAPVTFTKSMKVIGDCISSGYHHGDVSLSNSINGLARDFLCSNKILDGDGFFGNPIKTEAAASRYTSIKINPEIKNYLKEYSNLNSKNEEEFWNPLKVSIPFGLCVNTNGIGVGYSCSILPRKLEHIQDYLDGNRKSLKPFLLNFTGKIIKNSESINDSSWKILPVIEVDNNKKTIYIKDISPTISHISYIKKINNLIENYGCSVNNNSRESIDIKLKFSKNLSEDEWDKIKIKLENDSTAIVTENIVLIKDSSVLEYNKIEDYLDDFRNYREFLYLEKMEYDLIVLDSELEYLLARKKYLEFMMEKKRKQDEIESFLSKYSKEIYSRLDSLKLRFLNSEYLKITISKIEEYKKDIKNKNKDIENQRKTCSKIDNIIVKANSSKIRS